MKTNLLSAIIALSLCLGVLTFSNCSNDEDADPCGDFQCLNGGSIIANGDGCQCDCPPNFSGPNCETPVTECPVNIECPMGKSPNPANDCVCE